ncbi:hypothetical protein M8449_26350, partial [Citrobacter freundii]|nr:hypothetical protein [Citrobacter freundii]
MKDMMIDIEAERFNEWLEENYPDIVPESEAWEEAANLYYWEQEALADQAQWDHEHGLFVVGTVAKLAMRQPFVLFKGLTFQKLCLP